MRKMRQCVRCHQTKEQGSFGMLFGADQGVCLSCETTDDKDGPVTETTPEDLMEAARLRDPDEEDDGE